MQQEQEELELRLSSRGKYKIRLFGGCGKKLGKYK